MNNEQYTAKGETFVMEEDPSRRGIYYPVVIRDRDEKRGRWRSYRSDYESSNDTSFWDYGGYVPQWYWKKCRHNRNRWKFVVFLLIVSHIVDAKLPLLLAFFQP